MQNLLKGTDIEASLDKLIADKQLDEICQAMTERKPDQI